MFDPFSDFETAGYLRNFEGLKDPDEIKVQEHAFFEANLEEALDRLSNHNGPQAYEHFLEVHAILFQDFYPWAGQDRHMLDVGRLVEKGDVQFEVAERSRQAVEWGLRMGNDTRTIRLKPGAVMGAFAWGHPFLDGNGRTMLLVHTALCARAGFSIAWQLTRKNEYLRALTAEIRTPDQGALDEYFRPLISPISSRDDWLSQIIALPGLDGSQMDENVAYQANDADAVERYTEAARTRAQSLDPSNSQP